MILNRALEALGRLRPATRLLAQRAHDRATRPPLIVVLPCLGTRLADDRGRDVWGGVGSALLGGRHLNTPGGRVLGMLDGFSLVPGLWTYDVFGGLFRFLERVGGYRRDEDLIACLYDWRPGVRAGVAALAALVDRVRGVSDEPVDLLTMSSGGTVARAYLTSAPAGAVRRVVHVGVPHRGTFSSFEYLHSGLQFTPRARTVPAAEMAALPLMYDLLPHDPFLVGPDGAILPVDHYDPAVWKELGLPPGRRADLGERLRDARALHRLLDTAPPHRDVFAIASNHLRTRARALVEGTRLTMPPCCAPAAGDPLLSLYDMGDGSVPEASLRAVPGLDPSAIWWVRPRRHDAILSTPEVHALVLEALIATPKPRPLQPAVEHDGGAVHVPVPIRHQERGHLRDLGAGADPAKRA